MSTTDAADQAIHPDNPDWRRGRPAPAERRADLAMAAALFAGAVLSWVLYRTAGVYDDPASGPVSLLCLAAATLPLAWRRRWPAAVAVAVAAAFVLTSTLSVPELLVVNIALFMALYSVGAWEPSRRRATWVRVAVIIAMFVWLLVALFQASTDPDVLEEFEGVGVLSPMVAYMLIQLLTNILYFAGAYWFGDHAWASARDRARMRWRTRELQRERMRVESQAVTIERLRLARELHDSVGHHVSLMGVQAAAARTLLDVDAVRAATAMEHVEDAARDAISELHGLLGTLREDDSDAGPEEAVGSLGVGKIPELVEAAAAGGVRATYLVVGDPVPLPPVTSLNLYRIAQEALTNVRKHAGRDAHADVRLRYLDGAVELEVADNGVGPRRGGSSDGSAGRLGLVGMRERVAADGGTLLTTQRRLGGFVVRAQVPLRREAADARRETADV
ncbi:sensor histidine kinase [Cellulomonas cellasea]|uniref:sensor histidine kinase n=1 Tax=Cellulomonas cellasea TaxID=43670 RepID=UPI0025A3E28F|nr:sensor histidine kinase [Cellulomonas cellasea]MDM8084916.1 sensor histidine kinase [Cellulomonas cellasea]